MNIDRAKWWAETLYEVDPEFANEVYFALDEIFVKKTPWHQDLTQIVNQWVKSNEES